MTEDTTEDTTEEAWPGADSTADDEATTEGTPDGGGLLAGATGGGDRTVREYLLKGALVMLVVLGVVATLQFYLSAQTAIARLASTQYRPAFTAAFNLVVVLAVGVGIAQVVRRLG